MPEMDGAREREAVFAGRWAAGEWRGETLTALTGERFVVVYQGRPGGGAGPDFRDAVLARPDGRRVCGDVELHVRPECWRSHGHEYDPRYDGLALHIAIRPSPTSTATRTTLASGRMVPLVLLPPPTCRTCAGNAWPCTGLAQRVGARELRTLLVSAGMARFRQRANLLAAELRSEEAVPTDQIALPGCAGGEVPGEPPTPAWPPADRVLFVAVAEALAYGRDRAALRAAGRRLVCGSPPEAVARVADHLPRVERQRLRGLLALFARWQNDGPWLPLRAALVHGPPEHAARALVARLGVPGGLVSPGRAAIVAANVVLPFSAVVGTSEANSALAARAEEVYAALAGLPSNAITRLMTRQLGLSRLPRGAVAHLGLQHIWADVCREKRCDACPCRVSTPGRGRT